MSKPLIYGSSPPTWGIRKKRPPRPHTERFIPTYVGHTAINPRCVAAACGSSPPTWGIRLVRPVAVQHARFIPTYVGHTTRLRQIVCIFSVHPHLRGAYRIRIEYRNDFPGSSPPTWGIPRTRTHARGRDRFIPTYVGHTGDVFQSCKHPAVHPHLRGAYVAPVIFTAHPLRFIPTYVGHTPHGPRTFCRAPVHPHLRGAYTSTSINSFNASGSSPPTWGIPDAVKIGVQPFWFIPTYVGHTGYRLFTS